MNVYELQAKLGLDSSEYEAGLEKAKKGSSIFGSVLKANLVTKGIELVTKGLVTASKEMVAFAKASVQTGAQFDEAMSQVAATMGTTVDQIDDLREFAQKMGAETAFSATQAAEALNYMALAGYDAETSMQMLPTVLNLAAAGSIDLASASDMVTDAQSALGLTLPQTTEMVDQMAAASSKSNTSVSQLGEAFLTIGATARGLKGGTQELATVLGVLADNGIKGSEGGTKLRNTILSLQDNAKDGAVAFGDMSVAIYDSEGNMRSLVDIFGDAQDALSGMDQASKDAVLSGIFNKQDLAAVNALIGTSRQRFDELGGAIQDSAGAAEAMANTQLDNLNGDITLMQSALEGAKIELSDGITPALRNVVQTVTKALSRKSTQKYLNDLGKKLGDITNVLTGKVMNAIPRLLTLFDNGGAKIKAFGGAFAGLALAIKATVNPVGALATAFGLLIGKIGLDALTADSARKKHSILTDEMRDNIAACVDAADTYEELKKSRDEQMYSIDQESKKTEALWQELQTLVDANGKVIEGNEDRVRQISGELTEATGVEIDLIDGVIQKYGELSGAIENAIAKRRAEAMMEANEETYKTALKNLKDTQTALGDLSTEIGGYESSLADVQARWNDLNSIGYDKMTGAQKSEWVGLGKQLGELKSSLVDARGEYAALSEQESKYYRDIGMQEEAYKLAMEGNYQAIADLYANDSYNRRQHLIETGNISKEELEAMKRDAENANATVERYYQKLQEGADGFSEEGLAKLRDSADQLTNQYLSALGSSIDEVDEKDPEVDIDDNADEVKKDVDAVYSSLTKVNGYNARATLTIDLIDNTGGAYYNLPRHAGGSDYVPRNNYLALLHRGEAVLTAREADEWRRGNTGGGGDITINQYMQTKPQSPVEVAAATAAYFEQARWALV